MTAVLGQIEAALYAKLIGHAPLAALIGTRVYDTLAPQGSPLPYVVFQHVGGGDVNASRLRSVRVEYRIECIGATHAEARTGAGLIDDALHLQKLAVPGWTTYWMAAAEYFKRVDTVAGRQYYRAGGFYVIAISEG